MPSNSPASAHAPQPSSAPPAEVPVALRPRAPSQPTYADILSSMAPAADTMTYSSSNPDAAHAISSATASSTPSTSPLAPSAVLSSSASTTRLAPPRSVTEPAVSSSSSAARDPGPRSATLGLEGGGGALDSRSEDATEDNKPSNATALPAPPIASGKLVLEKLTLYETKTVRSLDICAHARC